MSESFPKGTGFIRSAELQLRTGQERILKANLMFSFGILYHPLMVLITRVY